MLKLTRYELTIDGIHNVGLIQGGYGLDILSDEDLEDLNTSLPMPPKIKTSSKILCFFTEKGVDRYANLVKIAEKNLKSDKNRLGLRLVTKELELSEVLRHQIIYQDPWQVHIREPIARTE